MTKIEDATNEQLDVAVAEKVMEWKWMAEARVSSFWWDAATEAIVDWQWSPSTNIAHAFEVNKPGWRWKTWELLYEWKPWLLVELYNEHGKMIAKAEVDSIDTAAHCRGRCLTALLACGVEEV